MPSRPSETMPSTMKLTMTIVAKTGRLMDVSEIHIAFVLATGYWLLATGYRLLADSADLRPGGQLASRVGEHGVAGGEARDDLHARAVRETFGDLDNRHG